MKALWPILDPFANRQRTSQELLIFCGRPKADGPLWQRYWKLKTNKKTLRCISLILASNNTNNQILRYVSNLSYCKANKNFNMTSKTTADCSNQSQITNSIFKWQNGHYCYFAIAQKVTRSNLETCSCRPVRYFGMISQNFAMKIYHYFLF